MTQYKKLDNNEMLILMILTHKNTNKQHYNKANQD